MRKPLTDVERHEFYHKYSKLNEPAWAALHAHMTRAERNCYRNDLMDPSFVMPDELESFRTRILVALDTLDAIDLDDEPAPNVAARRAAAALMRKVGSIA